MRLLIFIFHIFWGIIQNLYASILFIIHLKNKHYIYKNAIVTEWDHSFSAGIGMFIFIEKDYSKELLAHEYGHTVQSLILGPLFFPIIAIPSAIWCFFPPFVKYRRKNKISYFRFYPEKWANKLGYNSLKINK